MNWPGSATKPARFNIGPLSPCWIETDGNDPANGKAAHADELFAVIDKEKRSELDLIADNEIMFVETAAVHERSGFAMKIEQAISFRPRLDHRVAPRNDRIAQEHIDVAASSKNEVGTEREYCRPAFPCTCNRADGITNSGAVDDSSWLTPSAKRTGPTWIWSPGFRAVRPEIRLPLTAVPRWLPRSSTNQVSPSRRIRQWRRDTSG